MEEEMTVEQWFKDYDATVKEFDWFIKRYFPLMWEHLCKAREDNNFGKMLTIMDNVWFALPDGQFNIMVNPKGWSEFLHLLEDLPETKKEVSVDDVTLKKHQGNWHEFSVPFDISRDKAAELQGNLGYHPAGYGLYDFNPTPKLTTWKCSNSCD